MKKSLRLLLLTGVAFATPALAANPNSASDFSAEYLMNAALDVGQDTGMEQVNFSRNAGTKKAQEYLHGITNDVRLMLRNMETSINNDSPVAGDLGTFADTWGQAERIHIAISDQDTANTGANIDAYTGYNISYKFAKEHHVHHLDDVTFRFVPQISETEDGEFSIQGWYCETDIDWVDFTKGFTEPATSGSAAVGQAVMGQRSMVTRALAYPWSSCTVATGNIEVPTTITTGFEDIGGYNTD